MKQNLLKAFSLCLFVFTSMAASAYEWEIDGIFYTLNKSNQMANVTRTSSGKDYSGVVCIPENVVYDETTYSVVSIGDGAFQFCEEMTEVTIPNSVVRETKVFYHLFARLK